MYVAERFPICVEFPLPLAGRVVGAMVGVTGLSCSMAVGSYGDPVGVKGDSFEDDATQRDEDPSGLPRCAAALQGSFPKLRVS